MENLEEPHDFRQSDDELFPRGISDSVLHANLNLASKVTALHAIFYCTRDAKCDIAGFRWKSHVRADKLSPLSRRQSEGYHVRQLPFYANRFPSISLVCNILHTIHYLHLETIIYLNVPTHKIGIFIRLEAKKTKPFT